MMDCRATTRRLLAAMVLALVAVHASAGMVLERIRQGASIVIAHREASIPFSYVGPSGKPVGYTVDLCLLLVEALRRELRLPALKVEYLPVTAASRIDAMVDGRATLECGSTTNNAERRRQVSFIVPHYVAGARYLVRSDSGINDVKGFAGRRLASTKGTTPLAAVTTLNREHQLGIELVEVPDHDAGVALVESGVVDGFVMDDILLYGLIATRPDPQKLKVVGKFLTIEPLSIMLPRGDLELKKILNDEMKRLIRFGEARAIYDRWFMRPIPPTGKTLNLPMNYLLKDTWKYPTDDFMF